MPELTTVAATRVVNGLEEKRYIIRMVPRTDRRHIVVSLRSGGWDVVENFTKTFGGENAALKQLQAGFSAWLSLKNRAKDLKMSLSQTRCLVALDTLDGKQTAARVATLAGIPRTSAYMALESLARRNVVARHNAQPTTYCRPKR